MQHCHDGGPVTSALAIGRHNDRLDVTRAQRLSTVQEPPCDQRTVCDQPLALEAERVHAAERMLPVGVGEVVAEGGIAQTARGG